MAVESQAGWYWPKENIQRNDWKTWKKWARNAGFNVALLPLREEIRNKFNVTAATEWFKSLEGTPYGYHNFIFGWYDMQGNGLPPITDVNFIFVVFEMLEKVLPKVVTQFLGEALNKRLNTTDLKLADIALTATERGFTIDDLFVMPE